MKIFIIISLLELLVVCSASSFNQSECEIKYPSCEDGKVSNIVCERKNKCWAVDGCRSKMLTISERKLLLDLHNELRNRLALGNEPTPPFKGLQVSNMNKVQWDLDLEYVRQCWINTCPNKSYGCRKTSRFKNKIGGIWRTTHSNMETEENLKWTVKKEWYETINNSNSDVLEAMDSFNYNKRQQMLFDYLIAGHLTHIGCARSQKSNNDYIFSCSYGPGIIDGQQLLKFGPACSECPEGRKCSKKYPGLCALEGEEENIDNKHNITIFNYTFNINKQIENEPPTQ